jgi:hypothetical protein
MSATRKLRKLLNLFRFGGVLRVTSAVSGVGPPPEFRISHEFNSLM